MAQGGAHQRFFEAVPLGSSLVQPLAPGEVDQPQPRGCLFPGEGVADADEEPDLPRVGTHGGAFIRTKLGGQVWEDG
jgi:hypothetical protein